VQNNAHKIGGAMKVKFILMLIGLTSLFFAGDIELSLRDVVAIQDSSGLTRILFTFDTSQPIDTSMIDYAELFPRSKTADKAMATTYCIMVLSLGNTRG
jgi:hypothetical protein